MGRKSNWQKTKEAFKATESAQLEEIGKFIVTWSELHDLLRRLFQTYFEPKQSYIIDAIWHSSQQDAAQRKMLLTAVSESVRVDDPEFVRFKRTSRKQPEKHDHEIGDRIKKFCTWLQSIEQKYRNPIVHGLYTRSYSVHSGLGLQPDDSTGHRNALQLVNNLSREKLLSSMETLSWDLDDASKYLVKLIELRRSRSNHIPPLPRFAFR